MASFGFAMLLACAAEAAEKPVWLVANGFHTSIVLRTRDIPFAGEIPDTAHSDAIAFGWGASYSYSRETMSVPAILLAIFPNRAALHVIPFRGPIARRFPRSDIVLLHLSDTACARLTAGMDKSFARDSRGKRIILCPGYSPGSHFYISGERFYFPYVCNVWVAMRLRRAGLPLSLHRAILADSLIIQASGLGLRYQKRHPPLESY